MRIRLPVSGCLLLSVVCLSSIASAQTNWARTYGGPYDDMGFSVQQTTDTGYMVAGRSESPDQWPVHAHLVKTNARGDTLWTRTYGGPAGAEAFSVQQTADGGYVVAGCIYIPDRSDDVYLLRTSASGDTLWTRTYGGLGEDIGWAVDLTTDGGCIVAGWTSSFGAGDSDVYVIKFDALGDTLWTRSFGGPSYDMAYSVQQTADGGYIVAGETRSVGARIIDAYLIKINAQGDTLWTKTYGGSRGDYGFSVLQTADGGYVIGGCTRSFGAGNYDFYLIRTNASGDTLWTRTYGGADWDVGRSIQQTSDGGYIITGETESFGAGQEDVYLVKTDSCGDTLWTRTYGRADDDQGNYVRQTTDGDYVIAGWTQSVRGGYGDVCVVKTDGRLDAGPVAIQSPPGVVDSGVSYVPRAVVRNYGLTSGSAVQVTMEIGTGYAETVQETLETVTLDTVEFPAWTAEPVGSVSVKCYTSMVGDEDPTNDTIRDTVEVLPSPIDDVGAVAIVSPAGSVRAGDSVMPRSSIRNFGNRVERFFDVRFRIGASYSEKVNVADALPADSAVEITFPPWVAETGDWAVSCSTMLGSDENRANDKASSSLLVSPQSLSIAPDQSDRVEAGKSKTYQFHAVITGDTRGRVEVERPTSPTGWSVRLCDATGANNLTDTDGDAIPDLGYVAPGESGWFSLDVTAPSGTQGDTASLSQVTIPVAGHVGGRPDIADTAVLNLALLPAFSVHNFPNPFTDHTAFVLGLPQDGKVSLTVYTRAGERVCRVLANADLPAGVHFVDWTGVNDNGRGIAPGTYEYLLDYMHAGKTDRIRKRLVLTRP